MGKIYYSERRQSKVSQGKCACRENERKPEASFQGPVSEEFQPVPLQHTSARTWAKWCPLGKLPRDSVPPSFYWSLSHKHSLPSMYKTCKLPEGKQCSP